MSWSSSPKTSPVRRFEVQNSASRATHRYSLPRSPEVMRSTQSWLASRSK